MIYHVDIVQLHYVSTYMTYVYIGVPDFQMGLKKYYNSILYIHCSITAL